MSPHMLPWIQPCTRISLHPAQVTLTHWSRWLDRGTKGHLCVSVGIQACAYTHTHTERSTGSRLEQKVTSSQLLLSMNKHLHTTSIDSDFMTFIFPRQSEHSQDTHGHGGSFASIRRLADAFCLHFLGRDNGNDFYINILNKETPAAVSHIRRDGGRPI